MTRLLTTLFCLIAAVSFLPAAPVPTHLMPKESRLRFPDALGTKWVYKNGSSEETIVISGCEGGGEGRGQVGDDGASAFTDGTRTLTR